VSPHSAPCPTRAVASLFPCEPDDVLFAHQGGWDEALFVLLPLAIFGFLLSRAKRRAERETADEHPPDPSD
jgi:hypothetical protein